MMLIFIHLQFKHSAETLHYTLCASKILNKSVQDDKSKRLKQKLNEIIELNSRKPLNILIQDQRIIK